MTFDGAMLVYETAYFARWWYDMWKFLKDVIEVLSPLDGELIICQVGERIIMWKGVESWESPRKVSWEWQGI